MWTAILALPWGTIFSLLGTGAAAWAAYKAKQSGALGNVSDWLKQRVGVGAKISQQMDDVAQQDADVKKKFEDPK